LGSYVIFGLLRRDGDRIYNSAVTVGRNGDPLFVYDKLRPTPDEVSVLGVTPGASPSVFTSEFGRLGYAICFDINFPEIAESYSRRGVSLVAVPTAFPAGRLLDHWAVRYGFHVASSSHYSGSRVIDPTGATLASTSDLYPAVTVEANLDTATVHMDGNMGRITEACRRYGSDLGVIPMRDEAVVVLISRTDAATVDEIVDEFGIERLSSYFDRSRSIASPVGGHGAE
jgi:predicted amidohydrolase